MSTALMIVDVQQGMFDEPAMPPYDGAGSVARMRDLLDRARSSDTPVFFVQHDGGEGDLLQAGSPGFPFVPELTPRASEDVTVKNECDAFANTDLADKLRKAGVDRLVVCGMQTDMCVNAAVRAAAQCGFGVTLVSDSHTTYDTPEQTAANIIAEHNKALAEFAAIVPAREIAFEA
jgi:nicotinamidase-related amidase